MTKKNNFNLNLSDSCCTLVPKNDVWTVPNIAACQIAKNAALLIPDYRATETTQQRLKRLTGFDICLCPFCKQGTMHRIEDMPRIRSPSNLYSPMDVSQI